MMSYVIQQHCKHAFEKNKQKCTTMINSWMSEFEVSKDKCMMCSFFCVHFPLFCFCFIFRGCFSFDFLLFYCWYCIWCLLYVWSVKSQTIFTLYLVVCRIWINSMYFFCLLVFFFTCGTCFVFKSIANPKSLWKWYEGCWIKKKGIACYISVFSFSISDRDINTLMKIKYKMLCVMISGENFIKHTLYKANLFLFAKFTSSLFNY